MKKLLFNAEVFQDLSLTIVAADQDLSACFLSM